MHACQEKLTNGFHAPSGRNGAATGFALPVRISALSLLLTTRYDLDIHQAGIVWAAGPLAGMSDRLSSDII
jgi:hypothetical protein